MWRNCRGSGSAGGGTSVRGLLSQTGWDAAPPKAVLSKAASAKPAAAEKAFGSKSDAKAGSLLVAVVAAAVVVASKVGSVAKAASKDEKALLSMSDLSWEVGENGAMSSNAPKADDASTAEADSFLVGDEDDAEVDGNAPNASAGAGGSPRLLLLAVDLRLPTV